MLLLCCFFTFANTFAQVTPPEANTDAECGADCWDLFSWGTVQDGSGTNIPNFSEGLASDANCNTTIDATAEYTGADSNGPDLVGTSIGANLQGTSTDNWLIGFGTPLTNPVINFSALETTTDVLITDCDGNEITASCFSSCGTNLTFSSGVGWSGDVAYSLQLSGTYDCINISFDVTSSDAYNFSIGTCLGAAPFPPCVNCGPGEDFEYINLVNKSGSGTGATADIELDNVLVGNAEVLFSDLDINEDLSGTTFGGFDNDGGTYLLKLEFCEPITIQQLDIKNLEVESEVSIGTSISGSGASATLDGVSLTQCGGSNRMTLNDGAPNLVITDGPGCGANPNAEYTVGAITTDILYFKYRNPDGGCSFDYVGFKIGTCVPDGADAVPVCPLEYLTYATDIEDYVDNGPDFVGNDANAFQVMRDANGNFFNQNCTQIENEVTNGIAIPTVAISPCAEVVEVEECFFCDPPPPCTDCPDGSEYALINLQDGSDVDGDGLDEGEIYINGVCVGQFDVVYSDLDVNEDVSGTQFGGFDNDGGLYVLQLDFCDPLAINQLDIRNLEVESQVSVGTAISGTPGPAAPVTLSGLDLSWCAGSTRMLPEDPPVNQVITDGPGCGANPNASYTIGGAAVNTLYFQYYNPAGGCSYDYVGFKIGTCYTPPPMEIPVCPLEVVRVTCDMDEVIANGVANNSDEYVVDGNGNYFDFQNCSATALTNAVENGTPLQTVDIGCAELVETTEECVIDGCTIEPTCATTMCPDGSEFEYIDLDQDGTNAAGLPMGIVELNDVKVGTYEFEFSDLDVSNDGNGTTFGGWDNDGGTMLLRLDFCEPLVIQELDIRNLEVESQVSIGTSIAGTGPSAVLSGLTLSICDDPSGRMGVGPAPNEVITDGPGCGANPNGTYTIGTDPVTSLYFKYHNPDGGCRGDYVGFRIGACVMPPVMAAPTCPLTLYEIDECPDDPSNPTFELYQDANGNWFSNNICTNPVDEMTLVETEEVSACATTTFVEMCAFCCELVVECPPADLGMITCNEAVPTAATTEAEFEALGGDIGDSPGPCGDLVITNEDVYDPPTDICDGRTLTRTYTVSDDMTSFTCTQTLMISAPENPTIMCPPNTSVACAADISVSADNAVAMADCSSPSVVLSEPEITGTPNCDGAIYVYTYTVSDDCDRSASCMQSITLSNTGTTLTIPANVTVDCGDDTEPSGTGMAMATEACGNSVTVTHNDVSNVTTCQGGTIVRTWTATDDCGRTTSQDQTILVNAPDAPEIILCPANMTVTCEADVVPTPGVLDAEVDCSLASEVTVSEPVIVGQPGCDGTTYTFTYTITDECDRTDECMQTFTLDNSAPDVTVPADATVTCASDIVVSTADMTVVQDCPGELTLSVNGPVIDGNENCPETTYTYTYRAIDECGRIVNVDRVFTIGENDEPTITAPADYEVTCFAGSAPNPDWATYTTACNNGVDAEVTVTGPEVVGPLDCNGTTYTYTFTVTDACGRSAFDTQIVTVVNDGAQISCPAPLQVFGCLEGGYNDKIEAWIETVDATTACGVDLQVFNNFNGNAGICLGNNFNTVTFTAFDPCTNQAVSCQGTIAITDTDPPVIYAEPQELLVPCNGNTQATFNNWLATQGGAAATDACWGDQVNWTASVGPNALNCANGPQAIVVTFTAADGCGNSATTVGIFNTKVLPTTINVNGLIQREDSEPVANVSVGAYVSGVPEMGMSDSAGDYAFPELVFDEDTEIKPEKNDDPLNGVSTYDLVILQQHILGLSELNSPYKRIAADINRSGNVTTLDLVLLRKLILHIDEEFTDNTSWRFVDADFVFPNPENPFATEFPEAYNVVGQEEEVADFIAVKIGDLNLDGDTYGLLEIDADDRDLEDLIFHIEDQELIAGEEYRMEIGAQNFEGIKGFQFTLNVDERIEVIGLEKADLVSFNEQNYAIHENGTLTFSWHHDQAQRLASGDVAFSVILKTKSNIRLSEAIAISSQLTKAEAYRSDELMNVNLAFNTNGGIAEYEIFRLFQNQPNPFADATVIGFNLPEAGEIILEIYDVSGRLLHAETGTFAKGYNQLDMNVSDLPSGVLYYQLRTAKHSDSKKMIKF